MKKSYSVLLLMLLLTTLKCFSQSGKEEKSTEIYDLSLEELMDMDITTVSMKKQSASEAPAIISIITDEQIKSIGAINLAQAMSLVPGFTVTDTYWKRNIVTVRGINGTNYNDKILMLINGVATYDAVAMEYYLDLIPVSAVKRIEIIRGPGSTLYGTNAFAAVINIITKTGEENKGLEGWVRGNTNVMGEANVFYGNNKNDLSYTVSGSVIYDQGYTKEDVLDERGNTEDLDYSHAVYNLFTTLKYKTISLQAGAMKLDYMHFGIGPIHTLGVDSESDSGGMTYNHKYFFDAMYDKNINEKFSIKATGHFDYFDSWVNVGQYGNLIYTPEITAPYDLTSSLRDPTYTYARGVVLQGDVHASYHFNEKLNVLAGVTAETRRTMNELDLFDKHKGQLLYGGSTLDDGPNKNPINIVDYGAYVQIDGKLLDNKLGYVGGIRMTYLGLSEESHASPRLGLVYNLPSSSSFKLLFSSAFRGAGAQEQYYLIPGLVYGADAVDKLLKPESIYTTELAWEKSFSGKYKLKINAFYSEVYDVIIRRNPTTSELSDYSFLTTGTKLYDNRGELSQQGLEAEFNAYPAESLSFWVNASYKTGTWDTKVADLNDLTVLKDTTYGFLPYSQEFTANIGLTVRTLKNKLSISPNFQFIGEVQGVHDYNGVTFNTHSETFTVPSYGLLNLNITYQISEKLKASIYGTNITNQTYYYGELVRRRMQTIPGGAGRTVNLTLFFEL